MSKTITLLVGLLCLGFANSSTLKQINKGFIQFPNALPGQVISIDKALDPITGKIQIISNSPYVKSPEDLVLLERAEENLLHQKYGSMAPDTRDIYLKISDTEEVEVAIKSKYPDGMIFLNKMNHSIDELKQNAESNLLVTPIRNIENILMEHGITDIKTVDASLAISK